MRKRLLLCVLILVMVAGLLSGCDISFNREEETPEESASTGQFLMYNWTNHIFAVNEKGEKTGEYDREDLKNILADVLPEDNYIDVDAANGNIVICSFFDEDRDNTIVYAVNVATRKYARLKNLHKDYRGADFYNGEFYLTFDYYERIFDISEDLTYESREADFDGFFKTLGDREFYLPDRYHTQHSLTRTFDEAGYVMAQAKGRYVMITSDGKETRIPRVSSGCGGYIDYNKFFIYIDLNGEKLINVETRKEVEIPWGELQYYIGMRDDKIYYEAYHPDSYMMYGYDIFAYDTRTGDRTKIAEFKSEPGSGIGAGRSCDCFMRGKNLFLTRFVDGQVRLFRVDEGDEEPVLVDTDCVKEELTAFDYGEVLYQYETYDCPLCDDEIAQYYKEYFVLADEYSDYADVINASVKELMTSEKIEDCFGYYKNYTKEHCQEHKKEGEERDQIYSVVQGVNIVNDRFLTIDFEKSYDKSSLGYDLSFQLVYDLDTGKKLENSDIYKGSEEEFKKLIATVTRDFAKENEKSDYFPSSDLDEIYQLTYDEAGFETSKLKYYDDHVAFVYVVVMYYDKDKDPKYYEAFEIPISYQELIGTDTLTF